MSSSCAVELSVTTSACNPLLDARCTILQTPYTVESASYCAERKRWAAGGNDMWVHLYDYDTGDELDVNKGSTRSWIALLVHTCVWHSAALARRSSKARAGTHTVVVFPRVLLHLLVHA
jgi:hypothetical protein